MLMSVHVLFWLGKNLILLTLIYPSQIIVIEILHFKSMVGVAFGMVHKNYHLCILNVTWGFMEAGYCGIFKSLYYPQSICTSARF